MENWETLAKLTQDTEQRQQYRNTIQNTKMMSNRDKTKKHPD